MTRPHSSPGFTQMSYDAHISDAASQDQLVFKVSAFDPDESDVDRLVYRIVGGNSCYSFEMESKTGIISMSTQRTPGLDPAYTLNVSVTDGVFSSSTHITVEVHNSNLHPAPVQHRGARGLPRRL